MKSLKTLALTLLIGAFALPAITGRAMAQDADGVQEHPLITRYPGQSITWQEIENFRKFSIPKGPVTGYRTISDMAEAEGLVTRTWYAYSGTDRTAAEIFRNYSDALAAEGFEILGEGYHADRKGTAVGTRQWTDVYVRANPWGKTGEVSRLTHGKAGEGGAGAIVATRDRAEGRIWVIAHIEQDDTDYVGTLIDIVEEKPVESGRVIVDAGAIGKGIAEEGRVVLDGIVFAFDKADILPESKPALDAIAEYLAANPSQTFYVVGHTDSNGTFAYNEKLSQDRARAVADALAADYGVAAGRLAPHGAGPLMPVFSNTTDAGRARNRRVELVER